MLVAPELPINNELNQICSLRQVVNVLHEYSPQRTKVEFDLFPPWGIREVSYNLYAGLGCHGSVARQPLESDVVPLKLNYLIEEVRSDIALVILLNNDRCLITLLKDQFGKLAHLGTLPDEAHSYEGLHANNSSD